MHAKLSFAFRIALGGIFLTAGLAKISDPVQFLQTLREFDFFPEFCIRFIAVYIPWLEFVLGFFMLLGLLYRTSALLLTAINILFILAILSVLIRGMEIDCGCFGLMADVLKLPDSADMKAVIRNTIFVLMGLYLCRSEATIFSLEEYLRKSAGKSE
jgi:uncharacterized membrane protein YphA (DoxX/SURF4 family)